MKGEKACLRAFYYQLFKLAFEIEMEVPLDDSSEMQSLDYANFIKNILNGVGKS